MHIQEYLQSSAEHGQRNHNLFCAVLNAREQGWSEYEIQTQCAAKAAQDGLNEYEIQSTIASAMRRPVERKESVLTWGGRIGGKNKNKFLAWNDTISAEILPYPTSATIPQPRTDWQKIDLPEYLNALFEPSEVVSYLTSFTKDKESGICKPSGRGVYVRTCQEILNDLHNKTVQDTLFTDDDCGAWIRLNPMDGQGIYDKNVVNYRHALVEADGPPVETQWQTLQRLKIPCSTVTHSGGKSLHAAVRIDADNDPKEYARRVAKLYAILEANGLKIDTQNKNPSRLSRLPGCTRRGNPQYLLATNIGFTCWADWIAHIDQETDDMPLPESYAELSLNPPPLQPEIIHGILRRGHKLLLGGPSKAGKSYALIQLAAAICGGKDWLGQKCEQGNVLYVNLEIDRASFVRRVQYVEKGCTEGEKTIPGIKFPHENLTVWNLRGHVMSLDKLCVRLQNVCKGKKFDLIILDPIYKTNVGDENSARDMTVFCNLIESIANDNDAAICFAHHFSKGQQGAKASIDRASGSGVFGRDPDAIGTLTELENGEGEDTKGYILEWTLREFRSPEPVHLEWMHPLHVINNMLSDRKVVGSVGATPSCNATQISDAIQYLGDNKVKSIAEYFKKSEKTIRNRVKNIQSMSIENGEIIVSG